MVEVNALISSTAVPHSCLLMLFVAIFAGSGPFI
jgi:hypothetical protein